MIVYGALLYCCSSCIHQKAYFASPVNSMNDSYRTIPLQSDSLKTAFYGVQLFQMPVQTTGGMTTAIHFKQIFR